MRKRADWGAQAARVVFSAAGRKPSTLQTWTSSK